MTTSSIPFEAGAFTAPVVDYEPPPFDAANAPAPCPMPTLAAMHRGARRSARPVGLAAEQTHPPRAAAAFADAALRRVLEVLDRRRPIAQLRPMLTPALMDMVFTMTRSTAPPDKAGVLRRVRLRGTDQAAEVFATYTRGHRVRAIACRVEAEQDRWRMVALQIG